MNFLEDIEREELRYYQHEAVEAVFQSLRSHRSTLLVAATGLGKTQIFCDVARRWVGNVLVLAHRSELIFQAKRRLEEMCGEYVGIEKAGQRCGDARLVVGSIDTIKNKARMEALGPDRFSLIVFDEAHHAPARTYRKPLEYFSSAKILGVTATPDRGDGKALGQLFDDVCYTMDIRRGIEEGYLVPVKGQRVFLDSIDLRNVATYAGDFAQGQLDDAMLKAVEGIVKKSIEMGEDRQALAFFPGVRSAEYACDRFNNLKPGSACFVSGKTRQMERDEIIERFREGEFQYLCNCQIATEGFDPPKVSMVILGRPTKSRALYAQMVGRGIRTLPYTVDDIKTREEAPLRRGRIRDSAKKDCLILDFVGNSGRHKLVTPIDILAGNYSDDEVKLAKKLEEETESEEDPRELLEKARRELKAIAKAIESNVQARTAEFDPFRVLHVKYENDITQKYGERPASDKQKAYLKRCGMDVSYVNSLSHKEAKRLQGTVFMRRQQGLADYKQLKKLQRYGVNKINLSYGRASAAIDLIDRTPGPVNTLRLNEVVYGRREMGEDG
jgi:superfamily II DNA or RNA helicase